MLFSVCFSCDIICAGCLDRKRIVMDNILMGFVITILLSILAVTTAQDDVCEDTISLENSYPVFGKDQKIADLYSCSDLFERFPRLCELTKTNKSPWEIATGGNGGVCCQTCGDPTCLDKLTDTFTMTVLGKEITSCTEVVEKYPVKCKFDKKPGSRCCRSCQGVDTSCLDELRTFAVGIMCPEYIDENPCRCETEDTRNLCCASCAKYNFTCSRCADLLDDSDPAKIELEETLGDEKFTFEADVDNCEEIGNFYASFCNPNSFGGPLGKCCKSCEGVDYNCDDSISWRATVKKGRKKKNLCENCTCHDIIRKSKKLMTKACKKNIKGNNSDKTARQACCHQCRRLGFE